MHFTETAIILSLAMIFSTSDQFYRRCTKNFCGNFNYMDIQRFYGGLFKTKQQIAREEARWRKTHQRRHGGNMMFFWESIFDTSYDSSYESTSDNSNTPNHDFDQCCPTSRSHVNQTVMRNINGETRVIVHLDQLTPPQYQWIPHAECSSAPHFCFGTCKLENITLYLLVADFTKWPPFEFDRFSVPGYCSCKSS